MRFKSFSVSLTILLLTALVLPLIAIAKPLEPNPDTGWPGGTIWGTGLMIENSAKTDMSFYATWWGAKTGSEYAAPWPGYPPGATSYVGIWILKDSSRKGSIVRTQDSPPQSYSWVVQAGSDTTGDWGWLSWVLENATHEFVPPDFSAVLENVNASIHINLRAMDNKHMTLPWSATLYVDNAVNIENFENTTPLVAELGENVSFAFDIVNTGRYADNYALSANAGAWVVSNWLPDDNAALGVGESLNVTFDVTIGSSQDINVEAAGAYAWDNSPALKATVKPICGVEVSISPGEDNTLPGDSLTYTVIVKNTGNVTDTYTLENTDNLGWSLSLDNISLTVPENESRTTTLSVTIPENATGSTRDNITVTATSQTDNTVSDNASCIAHVTVVVSFEVLISPDYLENENGKSLTYTVTVVNTGNVSDNYTLESTDTHGWALTLDNNWLWVPKNENRETMLTVTIPENATASTRDNITVTATSQTDNTVENSATCVGHVKVIRGVKVSISPGYDNGLPGENLTYEVKITNTGNVKDNYSLTVGDSANPSWNPKLSENRLDNVQPGENRITVLSVIVPSDVAGCTIDNIEVTAISMENIEVGDSENCQAHALIIRHVEVSISPSENSGGPGGTVTYAIIVKNMGNVDDNYTLTASDDAGWSLSLDDTTLAISRGENGTTTLRVGILENAENCTRDNITITAISQADNTVKDSDSCVAHALIIRSVEVSISPSYQSGAQGSELSYTVTVKNTGNVKDNYDLSVSDNAGWALTLSENLLENVQAGGNRIVTLTVTIPENAAGYPEDNVIVTVTSRADNTIENSVSCIAHALVIRTEMRTLIYPSADIYAFGESGEGYSRSQLKFDVSGIPSGAVIISAKLWLYRLAADNWDGNVMLCRVENQTWDETITASGFDAQTLTDEENHTDKFMLHGWDYTDVLTQLKVDYNADHTYTSFRLRWATDNESEPSIGIDDGRFLLINSEADELSIIFCASEYNGRDPYLEVIYVPPYAVSTSISPTYKSGLPGETIDYTITVTNTGNLNDNYSLTVSDNLGWSPIISPPTISVAAGSSGEAMLTVTIPENATGCTEDNVTVTAISKADNTVSDNASCIAHAKVVPGVSVSISPKYKTGLNGESENFIVTVVNTGNVSDNYTLESTDNHGWTLTLDNNWLWVPKNENRETMLTVTIPENATGSTRDNITVTATSQTDNTVSSEDSCIVHVESVYGVEVSISPSFNGGPPGGRLVYIATVGNIGNTWDSYYLTKTDELGWLVTENFAWIPLAPDNSASVSFEVFIPENAEACTMDVITVTATSEENADVSDNDSCIARAIPENAFVLELVAGWNLVGFHHVSEDDTPWKMFDGIEHYVWYLSGEWKLLGDSEPFELGVGYWIWLDSAVVMCTTGPPVDNHALDLIAGWNLVSFPVTSDNTTPENLFNGIEHYVWYLSGEWKLLGDSEPFELGVGYWIWLDSATTVTVPL